jgi:succinoglycan biosynthesis transport protein ExoP
VSTPHTSILDEGRLAVTTPAPSGGLNEETLAERVLHVLRARWWVVLQALVVVPVAAFALSQLQPQRWTATSTLEFRPPRQNSGSVDLTRQAATESKLVALPAVAAQTARALGPGWTTRAVADAVQVGDAGDSNLVDVEATAASPAAAARLADTYATAFVDGQVQANVRDAQTRLAAIDRYISSLPPAERTGAQGVRLQRRVDRLRVNEALQSSDQRPAAEVAQRAELPTAPSSPKTLRNVILGLLLGGILGVALAMLLDRLDRAIKSVDELERLYGLPVLAGIPRGRGLGKRLRRQGAGEVLRQGSEAEAFRALRASLRYFNVEGGIRSLLVVSPEAQDGKSTVAACLATAFAQRGDRIALVETDLHKRADGSRASGTTPAEAVGAGGHHREGLSTVLAGADLDEALLDVEIWGGGDERAILAVLPSGPRPPNPSQLLESRAMFDLVKELERRYELVIYDSPAVGAVSDALALAHEVDGVIVVNRLHYTSRDRTRDLLKKLMLQRAHVLGIVANYADAPKKRGYDYYGS